ncbi:3-hydroxyacyl-CoA dehydrogenase NAD-binding domain-containing protein [Niveispirillum sp.]|uniref:3-hydroxyacyl-CoA dehydrogenase NAD-binding domain-containing protein n=1 Tax=Niveispirillum sp. TaxID=1917217 RepID=UPI001B711E3E|nr:3-hydroxyacyl-CoA dehydrogenase NAD-binding domain-containing protein [Niveispirillum sp.]MBP7336704.1 enoyl-CoA hydratase/isomerase family protein [Niveispirillum sp.]
MSSKSAIRTETGNDGIAILWWDSPGERANVMNEAALDDFHTAMTGLLADDAVTGIIVTAAKADFLSGADLKMLTRLFDADAASIQAGVRRMTDLLRAMDKAGKGIVAAINGHALGGGLELALACHHRIVADDPRLQLGLPEVKLGLIPGFGGTQRLGRLIGALAAARLIGEGRSLSPADALAQKLVHQVVPAADLLTAARAWLADPGRTSRQPWDAKGWRLPGGPVQSAGGVQLFSGTAATVTRTTLGHYPAPAAALSSLYHGLQLPFERGQQVETTAFVAQVKGAVAPAMVKTLFFAMNDANAGRARPPGPAPAAIRHVGIVGAGLMGAGIGYAAARAGLTVTLLDRDAASTQAGKDYSARLVEKDVARGRLSPEKAEVLLARIRTSLDYQDFAPCDVVVEAVFEDRALKQSVLARLEAVVRPDCLIASNTSTLPIGGLAAGMARPGRFLGLHFFSPVEKMPLVEIISGAETTEAALAAGFDAVRALRKTPVAVRDGRGFFTTRVFASYMMEGLALLAEGVAPALLDNAGRQAGMPMGPLRLADMVNIDLAVKIDDQTRADLGDAHIDHPGMAVARRMVALGRLGEKTRAGFYDHAGRDAVLWAGLGGEFPPAARQPGIAAVIERLMHIQAVEYLRCRAEGIVTRGEDADIASILGWGYPPFTGGLASHVTGQGEALVRSRCDALADLHGERYRPPAQRSTI